MAAPLGHQPLEAVEDEVVSGKLRCCCLWIPWPGRRSPPSTVEWWERINATERAEDRRPALAGGWWRAPLLKVREWSEIVAGPRWKTFIRRFRRINRHGSGRAGSARFQYDPLSYALNFDEGHGGDEDEVGEGSGGGFRDFSARWAAAPGSARSSMDLGGRDAPALFAAAPAAVAAH